MGRNPAKSSTQLATAKQDTTITHPAAVDGTEIPLPPAAGSLVPSSGEVVETTTFEAYREEHSGPLPHPKVLRDYEEACPGLGQTLIDQWKDESKHRREGEVWERTQMEKVVDANISLQHRGQVLAFLLTAAGVAISITLVVKGFWLGAALGGAPTGIVALVTFLRGRKPPPTNLPALPSPEPESEPAPAPTKTTTKSSQKPPAQRKPNGR